MRGSFISAAALLVVGVVGATASGNLLTDPSFETNPMGPSLVTALSNFNLYQNQWAPENGSIVGTVGSAAPHTGSLQAELFAPGTSTDSQMIQIVDVSSFATPIDANQATVTASSFFNADTASAIAGVYVSFYNASQTAVGGTPNNVINLDSNAASWQQDSFSSAIPATTRWISFQVAFDSNSISNSAGIVTGGFVDDAAMDIRTTPEPASIGVFGAMAAGLLMRRRSRR